MLPLAWLWAESMGKRGAEALRARGKGKTRIGWMDHGQEAAGGCCVLWLRCRKAFWSSVRTAEACRARTGPTEAGTGRRLRGCVRRGGARTGKSDGRRRRCRGRKRKVRGWRNKRGLGGEGGGLWEESVGSMEGRWEQREARWSRTTGGGCTSGTSKGGQIGGRAMSRGQSGQEFSRSRK